MTKQIPPSPAHNDVPVSAFGGAMERLVFGQRTLILIVCAVLTVIFALYASKLRVNASFDEMIPQNHPYIQNYFDTRHEVGGLGNVIRVVVANNNGDIFDPDFLATTREINDALFLMPGVDRAWMKSIWMSSVRWTEVTEEGFRGGAVMPRDADPDALRNNIRAAGLVGSLVGNDYTSIMIVVPLLETDPQTGQPLDYGRLSERLERDIRSHAEAGKVGVHIIGFAKLAGDLIEGMYQILAYFAIAAMVAALILFLFSRCLRSTLLVLLCSIVAVIWLMGLVSLAGVSLNPFSVLVPFLVFAIGVSHGSQIMNGVLTRASEGLDGETATRLTFRRLLTPGMAAVMSDSIGLLVLMVIDIPVIGGLAITASVGIALLLFTNLVLLPILFSFVGVSRKASEHRRVQQASGQEAWLWRALGRLTERPFAFTAIAVFAVLAGVGFWKGQDLKIGDLDKGAPELHMDSRYNQDVLYVNDHYDLTNDQFVVMVRTGENMCADYEVLHKIDDLTWVLRDIPGVHSTDALSRTVGGLVAGLQEGNPKWRSIPDNPALLGLAAQSIITDQPHMVNAACSVIPVFIYLTDHRAETLQGVVAAVEAFAEANNTDDVQFLLASGPSGIEAVTNIVVEEANARMLLYVYAAVILACLVCFRSWRAVVVAVVPLMITSVLAEAIMATLGMGVKVATLPVVALGVGIGVDYALYLLSEQLANQRAGMTLGDAYRKALGSTGKVVALVGITLSVGVVTWAWSPIKFQADMGIMLTFMFLWNMIGALIMVPALSYFLLRKGQGVPPVKTEH